MKFNYEGHSLKSGIYKLVNTSNGRLYIGSAKEFKERWQAHARQLKAGKHSNKYLQNDFNKCGSEVFEFHVVELTDVSKEQRMLREQHYLDQLHDNMDNCYNFKKQAQSPEGEKFGRSMKEIWERPEYRARQSEIQSQRTKELWQDPEYRAKHEEKIREFTQTEEYREKLREFTKARWANPEFREQVASSFQSEEFKKKVGDHSRTLWQDEEYRAKQSESRKAAWDSDPERKRKASERLKGRMAKTYTLRSPEGEVVTFTNMQAFCLERGLQPSGLCKVANGKWASYKGWTKPS